MAPAPTAPLCAPPATFIGLAPSTTGGAVGRCNPRRATLRYEIEEGNSCSASEDSGRHPQPKNEPWSVPWTFRGLKGWTKEESVDGELMARSSQTGLPTIGGEPE
nr:unnamed protein product [Digitaria exilis]